MADVFYTKDMQTLLDGKYILFFGDSNMRALYKDVVTLFQKNKLITENGLRRKLEKSFEGDTLLHSIGLIKGRDFKEHRRFQSKDTQFEYFFITKCLSSDVTDTLEGIKNGKRRVPDVVFMNSTLWDITRWGFDSVPLFKKNLTKLVELFKTSLPENTLVIWQTTPPLSNVRGAFLLPEVQFMNYTIRFEAMESNVFAHALFTSNGFDVIDFHHYLRLNVLSRNKDGVHWQPKAVRYMTNLMLTHISIAWEKPLPGRFASLQLDELHGNLEELCKERTSPSAFPNDATESQRVDAETGRESQGIAENDRKENQTPRIAAKDRLGDFVTNPYKQPQRQPMLQARRRVRRGRGDHGQHNLSAYRKGNVRYTPSPYSRCPW